MLFATFMALGAVYSWAYLPDVQRVVYDGGSNGNGGELDGKKRLETRNLEELGEGYIRACQEGQVIGVREKWADVKGRLRNRKRITSREGGVGNGREDIPAVVQARGRAVAPVEADGHPVA